MNDPHVKSLRYKLITGDSNSYNNCEPIKYDCEDYKLELDNDELVYVMKKHFSTVKQAKEVVDKLIRSWVISAAITSEPGKLDFEFVDADVIDRNPPKVKDGSVVINAEVSIITAMMLTPRLSIIESKYPAIPLDFQVNPEVETMWFRFNLYLEGKEMLLSMAYFLFELYGRTCR